LLQNSGSKNRIAREIEKLDGLRAEWQKVAGIMRQELDTYLASGNLSRLGEINRRLYQLEQNLTSEAGLPLRPWFKHLIYAPGLNTGYTAVIFPGVHDALEKGDGAEIHAEIAQLAEAFTRMIQGLNEIRAML